MPYSTSSLTPKLEATVTATHCGVISFILLADRGTPSPPEASEIKKGAKKKVIKEV